MRDNGWWRRTETWLWNWMRVCHMTLSNFRKCVWAVISVSLVLCSSIIGAIHFHWSVSIDRLWFNLAVHGCYKYLRQFANKEDGLWCNLVVHHHYKYLRQLANKEDSCFGYGFRSSGCDLVYLLLLWYPVSWWESRCWVQICSLEVKRKRGQQGL